MTRVFERPRQLLERYPILGPVLVGFLVFVLLGNTLAVSWLAVGARADAREGARAHDRQCELYPVSRKLYVAAERYDLITRADLVTYMRAGAPSGC